MSPDELDVEQVATCVDCGIEIVWSLPPLCGACLDYEDRKVLDR